MSYFSVVEVDVQYQDGRTAKSNYLFKTPFILSDHAMRFKFIANALLHRYPHFLVQYKTLLISLEEYNKYTLKEDEITVVDPRNFIKYTISNIKTISFQRYTQINNLLNIELFTIERKD